MNSKTRWCSIKCKPHHAIITWIVNTCFLSPFGHLGAGCRLLLYWCWCGSLVLWLWPPSPSCQLGLADVANSWRKRTLVPQSLKGCTHRCLKQKKEFQSCTGLWKGSVPWGVENPVWEGLWLAGSWTSSKGGTGSGLLSVFWSGWHPASWSRCPWRGWTRWTSCRSSCRTGPCRSSGGCPRASPPARRRRASPPPTLWRGEHPGSRRHTQHRNPVKTILFDGRGHYIIRSWPVSWGPLGRRSWRCSTGSSASRCRPSAAWRIQSRRYG